jgi:hypothetical protein
MADVLRITTGVLNTGVGDAVIGMPAAPLGLGLSKFAGLLGKTYRFEDSDVIYSTAVQTLYGGDYQYVQLAPTSGNPVLGQLLFWDTSVANNLYRVTTSETVSSSDRAIMIAGVNVNPTWVAGNYWFMQISGPVYVQFRATLTDSGAAGSRCYAAAVGGADTGFADVLDDSTAATYAVVSLMQGRFIGKAIDIPVSGAASRVDLMYQIRRF